MKFIKNIKAFMEKEETKEAIAKLKEESLAASAKAKVTFKKLKHDFDEVCEKSDIKIKEMINNRKEKNKEEVKIEEEKIEDNISVPLDSTLNIKSNEDKSKTLDVKEKISKKNVKKETLLTIGLSEKVVESLNNIGIKNLDDLKKADIDEISKIKGIGKVALEKIKSVKHALILSIK